MEMIHFNSLSCSACDRNFFSSAADGEYWRPVACQRCAKIRCRSDNLHFCCGTAMKVHKPLTDFMFLLNSPLEEVNKLTFEVCTSSSCIKCGSPGPLYRRSIREVFCEQCCDATCSWPITSPLETLYLRLFSGVYSVTGVYYLGMSMSYTALKFSIFPTCPSCKKRCKAGINCISCPDCCLTLDAYDCMCLIAFMRTLECIPLKYLPSLNYETWTNAFHCSICKYRYKETYKRVVIRLSTSNNALSSIPLHKMLIGARVPNSTTLILAQALRNKYLAEKPRITGPTDRPKPAMKLIDTREPSNYNDLPPSSTNFKVQLPTKMTCKCGRVDELKDMFDCLTCSEYGICAVCGLRNHKKHEIEETIQSVVSSVVSGCSEKTLRRISKLAEEYRQLNTQCEANYAKLCDVLGSTFKEAYTFEDLERAAEILSECDITAVESHVKRLFKTKKETSEAIGELCTRLQKLRPTE